MRLVTWCDTCALSTSSSVLGITRARYSESRVTQDFSQAKGNRSTVHSIEDIPTTLQEWDPNFVGAGLGVTELRRRYPNAVDPRSTSDAIQVLEQHQV